MSDLSLGSFTDHGPWTVEPSALRWLDGVDELRAAARAEVPVLMRRRRVPPLGRFLVTGVRSPHALMRDAAGRYGEAPTLWTGEEAKAFAKIAAIPSALATAQAGELPW